MPSTALPGKFSGEVECDLMLYKQEHRIFHIFDRCIRYADGVEIPDKTITNILDAYHKWWMQFGPAKVLYYDGEGAFNNDTAKAVLKATGTELRIRARGQHAATIEARSTRLRHLLHVMELNSRLDIPTYLLRSQGYCTKPCSPPTHSPFTMMYIHIVFCLGGTWQCFLTCLFCIMNSQQRRLTILEN
eukprot:1877568-Pyramimonas_sp.AAC.1